MPWDQLTRDRGALAEDAPVSLEGFSSCMPKWISASTSITLTARRRTGQAVVEELIRRGFAVMNARRVGCAGKDRRVAGTDQRAVPYHVVLRSDVPRCMPPKTGWFCINSDYPDLARSVYVVDVPVAPFTQIFKILEIAGYDRPQMRALAYEL